MRTEENTRRGTEENKKTLDMELRENKELRKTQKQRDLENTRQRKTKEN